MEYKLEITKGLEKLAEQDRLDDRLAILNLPAMYACEKGCNGCHFSNQEANESKRLSSGQIQEVINYLHSKNDVKFITINGRGDPFHPTMASETIDKVAYASSLGIQPYVFTAGDNLEGDVITELAKHKANIMISLFGNPFIDAKFFADKEYKGKQAVISENLRELIRTYKTQEILNPAVGITRIGMNYVISERDLEDETKIRKLKQVVNEAGLFFVANVNFQSDNQKLIDLATQYSNFKMRHSLAVDGPCRMGAASSITVDYDGTLYPCPYMTSGGQGNFFERLQNGTLNKVIKEFVRKKGLFCLLRKK